MCTEGFIHKTSPLPPFSGSFIISKFGGVPAFPLGTPDARDEGVDDIAAIVASGRINEYFEKKEREKVLRGKNMAREVVPPKVNTELAHNTLSLSDGTMILVGGKRSRAAETLMEGIQEPFEEIVMGLPDAIMLAVELACRGEYAGKRTDLWQHMVIVGGGARIKGFKEALTANLASRLSVQSVPGHESTIFGSSLLSQAGGGSGTPINGGTGANTPIPGGGGQTACVLRGLSSEFSKSRIISLNGGTRLRMASWGQGEWVHRKKLHFLEVRLFQG